MDSASLSNGNLAVGLYSPVCGYHYRLLRFALPQPHHRFPKITMKAVHFKRRILLAVTGLSPQIVTETLYALAVRARGRAELRIPTEVRLVTTVEGAERARLALLHPASGWFDRLCKDYALPPIEFTEQHIHTLADADGAPLADIRSPEDNTDAANFITECVRSLTEEADSALHVSIAGGRKTMGFYLGYALSLYGRPQDELSHVLVNAPFESHPDFFYPSPDSQLIKGRPPSSRLYDRKDAEVTLAAIPFVRMRDGLSSALLAGKSTFSNAVKDAQRALSPTSLELDPETLSVTAAGESFVLDADQFAFYWMMAEQTKVGGPGFTRTDDDLREAILTYYGRLRQDSIRLDNKKDRLEDKGTPESIENLQNHFDQTKSKLKRSLVQRLGERRAKPYQICPVGRVAGTRINRYGLTLSPNMIKIRTTSSRSKA